MESRSEPPRWFKRLAFVVAVIFGLVTMAVGREIVETLESILRR